MALAINGKCRSCGAPLIWLRTSNDKPIPVDAHSVRVIPGDKLFIRGVHISHFTTCPDARTWSNKNKRQAEPQAETPEQGKLL